MQSLKNIFLILETSLWGRVALGIVALALALTSGGGVYLGLSFLHPTCWYHTLAGLFTLIPILPILSVASLCRAAIDFTAASKLLRCSAKHLSRI